jgi:hypothetical protein
LANNTGNNILDISLEAIYDFIENGSPLSAPKGVADYLAEMDKVRAMNLRIDKWGSKDNIVSHLIKVDGYSYYLANKLYNQSIEYFYADATISKQAWLLKIAEGMERDINMSALIAENTSDFAKITKMRSELKGVILEAIPDVDPYEDGAYARPFKIYTMSPEDAGLPSANRPELSKWIDSFEDVSEIVKDRIKVEAGVMPGKYFLDPKENPRKV